MRIGQYKGLARRYEEVVGHDADQPRERRRPPQRAPVPSLGCANDHTVRVARVGTLDSSIRVAEGRSSVTDSAPSRPRGPLDIHDRPVGIERIGDAFAGPHELLGLRIRALRHQHAPGDTPGW